MSTTASTQLLHKDSFGKYKLQIGSCSKEQVDELKTTVFCLESHLKPMKSITNYKVEDLEHIAKTIGVFDETKKYKKPELYEELNERMKWK